jgi:hypothetical protein
LAIEPIKGSHSHRTVANETDLSLRYNIYGEEFHHSNLFGTYYGLLSEPVVQMDGWLSVPMHHVYAQARKLYRQTRAKGVRTSR